MLPADYLQVVDRAPGTGQHWHVGSHHLEEEEQEEEEQEDFIINVS